MTTYPTPRRFGYERIAPEPPSWGDLIDALIAASPCPAAALRGVWESIDSRPGKDGQMRMALDSTPSDLEERRELIQALITKSLQVGSA